MPATLVERFFDKIKQCRRALTHYDNLAPVDWVGLVKNGLSQNSAWRAVA